HRVPASALPPPPWGAFILSAQDPEGRPAMTLRAPTRPLRSCFELSLAPFQRGSQSLLAGKLAELCPDLGLRGIERRDHVHASLHRVAKAGGVRTAIDRELGGGKRLGGDQRHALGKFQRALG